jgi:GNAT superfamily N-acetyltransferase
MACLSAAFEVYRESYTAEGFKDTVLTPRSAEQRFCEMTILVAESDTRRVIGTAAYQVQGSGKGHLRGMAVHPGFQGKGVADRLLSTAEAKLRQLGCSRVILGTAIPLTRAVRFYCRNGYEPTGVVDDFFGMKLFEYAKDLD